MRASLLSGRSPARTCSATSRFVFPPSELPPALGATVLEITDGNPLFVSSLLDELVAQRILAEEDGSWRLRKRVEALGEVLPDSLRHLIERQVERLTDEDQRILEAGSAAGREFSAGAVAAALGLDADAVDERLQALTRSARLVDAQGLDSPPHRATSGRHAFVHALHQRVLYGRLSPARRARLHRRLGEAQETAWGDASDEIAAELALHFERGGEAPRAIRFLRVAAENAARRLAGTEAIAHLTHALGLVDRLARRDRPLEELRLQMALGLMLMNSRGYGAPEVDRTYRRAADLSGRIENRPGLYRTLRGLHRITLIRGDIDRAMALARKGVAMARKGGEQEELLEAHLALGVTLFYAGQLAPARAALARGLRLRRAVHPSSPAFRMLDPAIVIRAHLGFLAWLFGEEAEMLEHLAEMRRQASALGAALFAGLLSHRCGDAPSVRPRCRRGSCRRRRLARPEHGARILLVRRLGALLSRLGARRRQRAGARSGRDSGGDRAVAGDGGKVSRPVSARSALRRAGGRREAGGRARHGRGGARSREEDRRAVVGT